jgi:hypothetical protein
MTTSVDVGGVINSVANSAAGKFEQRSLQKILLKLTYLLAELGTFFSKLADR